MTDTQTYVGALFFAGALLLPAPVGAQQELRGPSPYDSELEARVWLDRGADPLLRRGEMARLYYRASHDAFVSIFQLDTNGNVRLLFPRSPDEPHLVQGGFDYRLLFTRSTFWRVDDDPGVGYFFLVASPEPFDFSAFGYSHFDRGWNLSRVGRQVYRDPHVAMDEFVAALIPDWQSVTYALDFVSYQVDARFDYPRFLCYDCHGFRPYAAWNPYLYACTSFRLVVYNDPYYYPATRYRGSRVVFVRPPTPSQPRFAFKERASNETARPLLLDSGRRLYSAPARVEAPLTTRSRLTGASGAAEVRPSAAAPRATTSRQGTQVPRNAETRPATVPGSSERPPAVAVPGGGDRPSTGASQDRSRPVLQPRPSSPPPAAPPPSARPSRGESNSPRAQPSTERVQPNAPRVQPTTPPSGSRPPSGGSTPPPVPAPRRPPPG